ncbi:MAG TPA: DUF695 domain-containing protein [Kofleriaceae bacterium]|nr:DUF695 domain-containing protein [Kofleriaceae bacterium]
MTDDGEVEDDWDFYPCQVDDAVASIFLNLRFEHATPPLAANTLFRIRVQMLEPDEHGMGTTQEASVLNEIEDAMAERAAESGLIYVGRIRSGGVWEVAFYGAPECKDALQAMRALFPDRRTYLDVRPDPEWGFYREFLLPDEERRQWMQDRRVTDALAERGDSLTAPRRIDHWAYFTTAEGRDQFVGDVKAAGFALERAAHVEGHELPFAAQFYRDDAAELEHIHDVVMLLFELAEKHDGDYDGWESPVQEAS